MPWTKVEGHSDCDSGEIAVVKESDGEVEGCHSTEEEANEQIAALEASEDDKMDAVANNLDRIERLLDEAAADDEPETAHKSAVGERHTMTFDTKDFQVKAAEDEGEVVFEAYGAVFGNKDRGGDILQRGSFKRTIDHNDGRFPLIADHELNMKSRLGVAYAKEDERGVRVTGHINTETQAGQEAASHLRHSEKHDLPIGMSFGYEVVKDDFDEEKDARLLKEIKNYEFTLTQIPMNPKAQVQRVKTDDSALREVAQEVVSLLASDPSALDTLAKALDAHAPDAAESHSDDLTALTTDIRELANSL